MISATDTRLWSVAQMTGSGERERNLDVAAGLVERAASRGCELVAFPENCTYMGPESGKPDAAEALDGPSLTRFAELARTNHISVLVGSFVERSQDPARPYNTSVLIRRDGSVDAVYRKIHLFDVDVAGDRSYRESDMVTAGEPIPVTGDVDGITVGLSVCFDLRFPWLYRALVEAGAQALFVPAAFTVPTGSDHWEVLLRARAIETQSFVLAAAQYGRHPTGRQTYGRSMIIDPWGTLLTIVADGAELGVAELDFGRVDQIRRAMPIEPT
jgi:predicted amidohydrolase